MNVLVNAFRWTGVLYVMTNKIFSSGFCFFILRLDGAEPVDDKQ